MIVGRLSGCHGQVTIKCRIPKVARLAPHVLVNFLSSKLFFLREKHVARTCGDNSSCFLENVSTVVQQQFKERKVQRNWMLVTGHYTCAFFPPLYMMFQNMDVDGVATISLGFKDLRFRSYSPKRVQKFVIQKSMASGLQ